MLVEVFQPYIVCEPSRIKPILTIKNQKIEPGVVSNG